MTIKTNLNKYVREPCYTISIPRPVEMKKKILGDYQLCIIVGHHGWPTKKIFHFKLSETARKT